jgi:hypothetical protein
MPTAAKHPDLPLPLKPFRYSPTLALAGATVHGAVFSVASAYWQSGCRSLPADDAGLQVLARTYGGQWFRVRDKVKKALSEITPELSTAYAKALKGHLGRSAVSRLGGLATARKAAQAPATAPASPSAAPSLHTIGRTQPSRTSPYRGDGRTDMQARQAAIGRERSARTGDGFLTEGPRHPA